MRDHLSDLDEALAMLGVAVAPDLAPLPVEDEDLVEVDDIDSTFDDLSALEQFLEEGSKPDQRPDADSLRRAEELAARRRRSMVAYMLVPDGAMSDDDSPQPVLDYRSVAHRRVPDAEAPPQPSADAWSVARAAHDHFRARRPGRIDIAACVALAARREPITSLPRVSKRRPGSRLDIFVDVAVRPGPLGGDVKCLERTFGSVARDTRLFHIRWTGERWIGGSGPIWTFTRLLKLDPSTTAVVITGAHLVDAAQQDERWTDLTRTLNSGQTVVVVAVGSSSVPRAPSDPHVSWLSYDGR